MGVQYAIAIKSDSLRSREVRAQTRAAVRHGFPCSVGDNREFSFFLELAPIEFDTLLYTRNSLVGFPAIVASAEQGITGNYQGKWRAGHHRPRRAGHSPVDNENEHRGRPRMAGARSMRDLAPRLNRRASKGCRDRCRYSDGGETERRAANHLELKFV